MRDKAGLSKPNAEETHVPKPVFTLAFARAAFDAMVFDDGIARTTKTHERRVFYAGAQSLLDILTTGLDQEHEGDARI